ncbi:LRP5_6 [Mytilus coruscus]|uniref:LRP5_6 n=1 Tax=Mytilus coruscus TaxID=42192 RepID=A0A6J8ECG6_MYTCO|nr:LRP5_6 [Mytilus coruscus]
MLIHLHEVGGIAALLLPFGGSEPVLFLGLENDDGIISLDLNNGDITVIVDAVSNAAIDYHNRLGLLYYTDLTTRTLSRIRYPPNGNTASPEIIIQAVDDHRPIGVAVDSINNYIYWADDYADSITKADLCGFNQRVILQDSSINKILGIALDTENRY